MYTSSLQKMWEVGGTLQALGGRIYTRPSRGEGRTYSEEVPWGGRRKCIESDWEMY